MRFNSAARLLLWTGFISALSLSCGKKKKSKSDGAAVQTYAVSGSLSLADSAGLALTATTTTLKATYAEQEEDSATLDASGAYALKVKPYPFALTVFQDSAPVCSFLFPIGDNKIGSLDPEGDMNFGAITCEDGQAIVPADKIKVKGSFADRVKNGEIDGAIKEKLLDANGLKITMLSLPGGQGGEKGGQGPQSAQQGGAQGSTSVKNGGKLALEGPQSGPAGPNMGGMGGGDSGFKPVEPKACTAAGYSVPEFFYRDYQNNYGEKAEEGEGGAEQGPTLFITEGEDGKFSMIARSQSSTGDGEEDEIFDEMKLSGVDEEFALVGTSNLPENDVKSRAAEGILREIRFALDSGNQPPPPPTFTDPSCDPANMVNRIITSMGYDPYTVTSVFKSFGNQMPYHKNGSQKPLCSTLSSSETAKDIRDFCYEADGTTLKNQATVAGSSICQAAHAGLYTDYWSNRVKDSNGAEIEACSEEWSDAQGYHQKWLSVSKSECEAKIGSASNTWWNWRAIERSMALDCSQLRLAGTSLKVCYWASDYASEPSYQQPDWDTQPQPNKWWEHAYTLKEADAAIDAAKSNKGGGQSEMYFVQQDIDRCLSNFERTSKELGIRTAQIDSILTAVEMIQSSKNADGSAKYLKESVEKFKKNGDFSFTAAEIASLSKVLAKAKASLKGWADSITQIKETYAVLKKASVKADQADSSKCLPDELGTEEKFKEIYAKFDKAFNGVSGSAENRGLTKWQDAAFNHFQCMNMDDNLRRIRDFGMSAPVQGVKDSNSSSDADSAFLVEECSGFIDHRGRCIEQVACKIPSGAKTYIPMAELLDLATLDCGEIKQKVAMMGRVNRSDRTVQVMDTKIEVPSGALTANVMLMTSLPKKDCKVVVKTPKLDSNSCFEYATSEGKSWSDLTADELKTAKPSDFSLQYDSEKVKVSNLASREIFEVMLKPASETEQLKDEAMKDTSTTSDLDSLISE